MTSRRNCKDNHNRLLRRCQTMGMKSDKKIQKDLIDFDVIKGSALFHTKPSNHNKEMVRQGFFSIFFFPFYKSWWIAKLISWPCSWKFGSCIYLCHVASIVLHILCPDPFTYDIRLYEVYSPLILLIVTAIGYARVEGLLTPVEPLMDIDSPAISGDSQELHSDNGVLEPDGESSTSSTDSGEDEESSTDSDENTNSTSNRKRTNTENSKKSSSSIMSSGNPWHDDKCSSDYFTCRTVNVCVWDEQNLPQKIGMCVSELRATILAKVKTASIPKLYRYIALFGAILVALLPIAFRVLLVMKDMHSNVSLTWTSSSSSSHLNSSKGYFLSIVALMPPLHQRFRLTHLLEIIHSISIVNLMITLTSMVSTGLLAYVLLAALADAELTYQRRFLYAKCFTALTSSRRAKRARLPHFRLKNVVNIKAWLSLRGGRSWLKRQGRQRAADEIVSSSFLVVLVLLVLLGYQAVTNQQGIYLFTSLFHCEVYSWCFISSIFLLRFMMLGAKINRKYQNSSLLLTEQMNLYLRILQAPHKKDRLLVSNNVLKLAAKLLKELNSPNKVSGLTMNPLLYNITRVVLLSAFSAALSEFFGFKLKLWKMKV